VEIPGFYVQSANTINLLLLQPVNFFGCKFFSQLYQSRPPGYGSNSYKWVAVAISNILQYFMYKKNVSIGWKMEF